MDLQQAIDSIFAIISLILGGLYVIQGMKLRKVETKLSHSEGKVRDNEIANTVHDLSDSELDALLEDRLRPESKTTKP